jgi:HEAT repeat protein
MKNLRFKIAFGGVMLILALASSSLAQLPNEKDYVFDDAAISNLKSGISSENLGLRKSSIYFAGKYRVDEVLLELMSQLEKEGKSSVRILIAHSLYLIGDSRGIYRLKELASNDQDDQVRRMATALFNEYQINNGYEYVHSR